MAGYVLKAAKRVFGIPEFHYYCIADGLTSIFARYPGRIIAAGWYCSFFFEKATPQPESGFITIIMDSRPDVVDKIRFFFPCQFLV